MSTQNGTNPSNPFDALAANFRAIVELMKTAPVVDRPAEEAPAAAARAPSFIGKAGKLIKDYPLAALGIAFGAGYLVMRLVRR